VDRTIEREFLDPAVLARLSRQSLEARLPMGGNVSGLHKSPHRGSSVEFAEYRKYAPGDDLRRLDWRVYGRTDRFYIREFEADTNLRCYLVLDTSGSMSFGDPAKIGYAQRLLATLAYLLVQQGDAVGLQCFADGVQWDIPPRRNPSHLQHIFKALTAVRPRGETGLVQAVHDLAGKIKQRALVIVFSDFFCDPNDWRKAMQHLRFQKHDVALFHLLDRRELEFNFARPMRFLDLEKSDSLLAEPAIIRRHYLSQLQEFIRQLQAECSRLQADYRRICTDEDYEMVLADFLVERSRTRGQPGK
jgi:uncharacterized protein (DUF58 family)